MPGKYNAKRTTLAGITFDSKAESRRYTELLLLERAGQIADLKAHPRYVIWAGTDKDGKMEQIAYEPDFYYVEAGRPVCEDVKGGTATQTRLFQLKAKMFRCTYPDIELRIVER